MSNIKRYDPLSSEDLLANQELNQRFVDGMCQKNIEQVMSCIWDSPDFIFVATDGTVFLGSDNFRKTIEEWFVQFESLHCVIDEVKHIPAGDSVFAVGTGTYELKSKDGSLLKLRERWTDVRQKIGGRWIYVLDHAQVLTTPDQ